MNEIPGVSVQDIGAHQCAIVTFSHEQFDADSIKAAMSAENINISVSKPDSTLLDAQARALPDLVRVSPHYYNSEDELEILLSALRRIISR